jgi:hypothetical protein
LEDADADLSTTDDQTPLEGWEIYLSVDGERLMPGKTTGLTGCATWFDLQSGQNYIVEENTSIKWIPLTPLRHDFGIGNVGDNFVYTFINSKADITEIYLPVMLR